MSPQRLTHTPNHRDCPACNRRKERIVDPKAFGKLTFAVAAPMWLEEHRSDIAEKTHYDYEYYIRSLCKFFGELTLEEIHIGHIGTYQEERKATAGPSCINHELNTLKQVLVRAKLWDSIRGYKPLKVGKSDVGRAMEPADEERLFRTASTSYRWKIAYWCSILTATTTIGPTEISHLHFGDVDLASRPGAPLGTLHVHDGLKNGYRERLVPLNESSRWAMKQILDRYFKRCTKLRIQPNRQHYILMGRGRNTPFDPWKPMGSWKKAWCALRIAAGLPTLRRYDLRHHAITKLMEDPNISEQTIEDMAGHALRSSMKKLYSHIRIAPKTEATTKLELKLPPAAETAERISQAAQGD